MVSPTKQAKLSLPVSKRATRGRSKRPDGAPAPPAGKDGDGGDCPTLALPTVKVCLDAVAPRQKAKKKGAKKDVKRRSKSANMSPCVQRIDDPILLAKCRLTTSAPCALVGRDDEMSLLREAIGRAASERSAACLYLSGPPGTGKTATVTAVLNQFKASGEHSPITAFVNCVPLRTRRALITRVLSLVDAGTSTKAAASEERLKHVLTTSHRMIVLVLDEIDHLESRNNATLYTVFDWPSLPHSRLVLVGIANSLDLTDRLLPRLHARAADGVRPQLVQYAPYSKEQVARILKHRLLQADDSLAPAAVELCARKVASVTGDIRRALDVAKSSLDKLKRDNAPDAGVASQSVVVDAKDEKENVPQASVAAVAPCTPKVGCKEMLASINEVYGSRFNAKKAGSVRLPLQQKLLVAGALAASASGGGGDATVAMSRVYAAYVKACELAGVARVPLHEAVDMCDLLAATGLLAVQSAVCTPGARGGAHTALHRRNAGSGTPRGAAARRRPAAVFFAAAPTMGAAGGATIQLLVERATAVAAIDDEHIVTGVLDKLHI